MNNSSILQALAASRYLHPENLRSLGTVFRRPNISKMGLNQERQRIRRILNGINFNTRPPRYAANNLNLIESAYRKVRQIHHNNRNRMVNNIVILLHPNKVRLTPVQLKRFFKLYGNVMTKRNRNILAGRNRTGQTNANVYLRAYPPKKNRR